MTTTISKFYNLEHTYDMVHPSKEMFIDMMKSSVNFNDRMSWNVYAKLYSEFAADVYAVWRKLEKKPDIIIINNGVIDFIFKNRAKAVTMSFCVEKSMKGWYTYRRSIKSRNLDFVEKLRLRIF